MDCKSFFRKNSTLVDKVTIYYIGIDGINNVMLAKILGG